MLLFFVYVCLGLLFFLLFLKGLCTWLLERSKTSFIFPSHPKGIEFPGKYPAVGDTVVHSFGESEEFTGNTLRVVSLNMERGKQFDRVLEQLQKLNADIILLQEVEYFSQRTGRRDQAGELAKALKMNSVFACKTILEEYIENIPDDLKHECMGADGNALLSKYPFKMTQAIQAKCFQALNPGHRAFTKHMKAFGIIKLNKTTEIACCSVHLDPHYTGRKGRINQFNDLVSKLEKYSSIPMIVAGDFNTVCTGIGRFNIPKLSLTFKDAIENLGKSEALQFQEEAVNLSSISFKDPFDKQKDTTFTGMSGLYSGKLDWCLLHDLHPIQWKVGNRPQDLCSDHMWICVDINIDNN